MIKMAMLTGPYAGQTRDVSAADVGPEKLLGDCLKKGWEWDIDYSAATQVEAIEWFRHDLSCRVIRALHKGLPVRFLEKTYVLKNPKNRGELKKVAGQVEDAIVRSSFLVSLEYDDERGVRISTHGHEH